MKVINIGEIMSKFNVKYLIVSLSIISIFGSINAMEDNTLVENNKINTNYDEKQYMDDNEYLRQLKEMELQQQYESDAEKAFSNDEYYEKNNIQKDSDIYKYNTLKDKAFYKAVNAKIALLYRYLVDDVSYYDNVKFSDPSSTDYDYENFSYDISVHYEDFKKYLDNIFR